MILDSALLLSGSISAAGVLTGQSVTGAGNVLSTNTIDLAPLTIGGNQAADYGAGEQFEVVISILAAPTVGTSVQFQLIQADDAALTTNVQVIRQTDAFPIASLPVNTVVPMTFDPVAPYPPKRYVGIRYVNVGAIATLSVVAGVVKNAAAIKNTTYKSGFAVS